MHRIFLTGLFLVSLAACGRGISVSALDEGAPAPTTAGAPAATSQIATTSEAEAPTNEVDDGPSANDLVGRWAHFDVVAYQADDFKTLIISYGFNDFTAVDGEIVDSAQFCSSAQRTNQPITAGLSDAATQAIKPPSAPLQVDVVDETLLIRREATPTPVGIRLDDPATESLPTDPNDPRIVDDDGDGKPGLTVTISAGDEIAGELYIARLEIFAYEAQLTEPDLIEGSVIDNSQQLLIGASDPIFLSDAKWEQVPDPALNPIVLKRVDSSWDCDRLAAERDILFPTIPDVDW